VPVERARGGKGGLVFGGGAPERRGSVLERREVEVGGRVLLFRRHEQRRRIDRKQIRVREAQQRGADRLRQGAPVREVRVGEPRVPGEVVVNGVINALFAFSSVAQVQGGDA